MPMYWFGPLPKITPTKAKPRKYQSGSRRFGLQAETRDVMQTKHGDQEGEPDRVGAIQQKAFHRRQIDAEQPEAHEQFCQRPGVSGSSRYAEVFQWRIHKNEDDQRQAGIAHGQRGIEIAVMAVRRGGGPSILIVFDKLFDRYGAPEGGKAVTQDGTNTE